MGKCRDCKVCSRSAIAGLFYIIPHIIYAIIGRWTFGLFKKHCPECGHWISSHAKRRDGSFKD